MELKKVVGESDSYELSIENAEEEVSVIHSVVMNSDDSKVTEGINLLSKLLEGMDDYDDYPKAIDITIEDVSFIASGLRSVLYERNSGMRPTLEHILISFEEQGF